MINLTIAKLRKEKRVTQSELASHLGVSFQTVSKWENGITMPDITLLPLISDYFSVSTDEILGIKPLKNDYISRDTDESSYWDSELASEGRDYAIGQRLPCYMMALGLKEIDCRLNDRVTFIDPNHLIGNYEKEMKNFKETMLSESLSSKDRIDKLTKLFMSRGMTKIEIDAYIEMEENKSNYINNNEASIVKALGLLISYGRK